MDADMAVFLEKVGRAESAARWPFPGTGPSGRTSGDGENMQNQRHAVKAYDPES